MRKEYDALKTNESLPADFIKFLENQSEKIEKLEKKMKDLKSDMAALLVFYGETAANASHETLFTSVNRFIKSLQVLSKHALFSL